MFSQCSSPQVDRYTQEPYTMSSSHMFYEYPFPFKFTTFHPKKRINVVCVRRVLMGHNNFRLAQIIRANSNRLEGGIKRFFGCSGGSTDRTQTCCIVREGSRLLHWYIDIFFSFLVNWYIFVDKYGYKVGLTNSKWKKHVSDD